MIRTRIYDFGIGFIVAGSAMFTAQAFVSRVWALLFSGCVGGAVYVAMRQRREGENES